MSAYYNEIDPYAVEWLKNLIAEGLIAPGEVDGRDIAQVRASDLVGFRQCHFFAGIGGWSLALRRAGWPDDREAWTGSCPCQPFSAAGKRGGFGDARHLWPEFFRLIRERQPVTVFGEQVASGDGLAWLDVVRADLEGEAYAVGAVDLGAAGVGAPHIRQRLWFVADTPESRRQTEGEHRGGPPPQPARPAEHGGDRRVAHAGRWSIRDERRELGGTPGGAEGEAREQRVRVDVGHGESACDVGDSGRTSRAAREPEDVPGTGRGPEGRAVEQPGRASGRLADANRRGRRILGNEAGDGRYPDEPVTPGPTNGFWAGAEWIPCRDGKARPVESGLEPLSHGVSGRVAIRRAALTASASIEEVHWYDRTGALKGFGNAINPEVGAVFVRAYLDLCKKGI